MYGLRNGDHERYRRHCANVLHRLRQVTGLTNGKGKQYKKAPEVTKETATGVKHLHLLLFSAERAMAQSHGFKAAKTKPNAPANTRRDQISWLRRAVKYAAQLHDIATALAQESPARLDQRTLAEITIYNLALRSELSFERQEWEETLTSLAARRKLLGTIAEAARDSYDQALAVEFIDAYDPLIRFSAYKLGRAESHDIEGVVADIDDEMIEEALPGTLRLIERLRGETGVEEMEKGRKDLEDVTFGGDKVELRSAEIVGVMLKVQEALGRLERKKDGGKGRGMRGWDRVLAVLGEAESVGRRLLDDQEASGSSNSLRSTRTSESLSFAHQYIVFLLLSNRVKRDLLLVDALQSSSKAVPSDPTVFKVPGGKVKVEEAVKNLAAVIKLYDTVLQSMSQLRNLAIVEERDGVRASAQGVDAFFHASRLYNLARLHCIHPSPSYASAVQLLERASQLLEDAKSALFVPGLELEEQVVELKEKDLDALSSHVNALSVASKRALFAERVPKPVFFDNAFNYIDLPMDELLVLAGEKSRSTSDTTQKTVVEKAAEVVEEVVPDVVKSAVGAGGKARATREATPVGTPGRNSPAPDGSEQGRKGWLGGWFGRG